tara:strand:- start:16935 stop:17360 length:426 start_codon:yes stop_codon:yes gene_type:complete
MDGQGVHTVDLERSVLSRTFWFLAGLVFVAVGMVGVVVPGLPTTPLMILAAACFAKSSQRFYDWIIDNKMFGHHVKNYREGRGIPAKSKRAIIPVLWFFVLFAIFAGIPDSLPYAKVATLALALLGTAFILRIPNLEVRQS